MKKWFVNVGRKFITKYTAAFSAFNPKVNKIKYALVESMAKTHIYQKKTAWIATPPHVPDHRKKVEAVTGK